MKIGIVSLGCSKNLVDSENLLSLLKNSDQEIVSKYEEAEAIIINTCGFIESAKKEAIDTILQMSDYKLYGSCKYLIVMGCLAQRYQKDLTEEMPEVDRFIGIYEYNNLGNILSDILKVKIINNYGKTVRTLSGKPWMAYLKIAEGCDNKCTYCSIPLIRGKLCSRKLEDLLIEATQLAKMGVKELNVIAQDTTRYGLDIYGERRLLELLEKLNEIEGIKWIRILYMYPDEVDEKLIKGMAKLDKVLPYFDIPVQYGNDELLKMMNRRGSVESIKKTINLIRETFKSPVLRTTIIVGFPNETEKHFEDTLKFIEEVKWDRLGGFTYSKEEDTPAYNMKNEVEDYIKVDRLNRLMKLQEKIVEEKNNFYINKELEVLIEGYDALSNRYRGRSILSAPDGVDSEVYVISNKELNQGDFVNVKITKVKKHDLIGEIKE
ncbi:MAG: 30S ribosomal protein S12 methylthiotransferase RimO [Erysipelotrichaceae bacterium]|nr:30S ribosomal protein S12 methylthiotransferase RimO [Erysipelotrichaceae bacterium]